MYSTRVVHVLKCYYPRVAGTITRKTRDGTADAPKWILDMFACWDKDDTEKCNSSMTGDRSSHNSSIPAADFVEMVISTEG